MALFEIRRPSGTADRHGNPGRQFGRTQPVRPLLRPRAACSSAKRGRVGPAYAPPSYFRGKSAAPGPERSQLTTGDRLSLPLAPTGLDPAELLGSFVGRDAVEHDAGGAGADSEVLRCRPQPARTPVGPRPCSQPKSAPAVAWNRSQARAPPFRWLAVGWSVRRRERPARPGKRGFGARPAAEGKHGCSWLLPATANRAEMAGDMHIATDR